MLFYLLYELKAGVLMRHIILSWLTIFSLQNISGHANILSLEPYLHELPTIAPGSTRPADLNYSEGIAALNRKDWPAAKSAFNTSLQFDPKNVDAMLGLAHAAAQQNKSSEVESWLQKALLANPQSASAQMSWGRYLIASKRYTEAETALKKATAYDVNALAPTLALGDLYIIWLKNPKAAADAYKQATRIDPKHAGAHHGLGMSLLQLGSLSGAETALKTSLSLAGDNPLPRMGLGRVNLAQRRHSEAIKLYSEVLKRHQNLPEALIGRGDGYFGIPDLNAAIKDYRRAIELAPKNAEAYLKLGMALQAQQKLPAAEKSYLKATQLDSSLAVAYNNLAWIASQDRNRSSEAVKWAEKAVEVSPLIADFHDTLGWIYHNQARYAEAEKSLKKAIEMQASPQFLYHLGLVYQKQGKNKEAGDAYTRSLSLQKDFKPSQNALNKLKAGVN